MDKYIQIRILRHKPKMRISWPDSHVHPIAFSEGGDVTYELSHEIDNYPPCLDIPENVDIGIIDLSRNISSFSQIWGAVFPDDHFKFISLRYAKICLLVLIFIIKK